MGENARVDISRHHKGGFSLHRSRILSAMGTKYRFKSAGAVAGENVNNVSSEHAASNEQ